MSLTLNSQQKNPITDYKYFIENTKVISENKMPSHASFTSFSTLEEQEINKPQYYKSLNGVWKFNWVKDPKNRPTTFMNSILETSNWDEIKWICMGKWSIHWVFSGK